MRKRKYEQISRNAITAVFICILLMAMSMATVGNVYIPIVGSIGGIVDNETIKATIEGGGYLGLGYVNATIHSMSAKTIFCNMITTIITSNHLVAKEEAGAVNLYRLTGGNYDVTRVVDFLDGVHYLDMELNCRMINGTYTVSAVEHGSAPEFPEPDAIQPIEVVQISEKPGEMLSQYNVTLMKEGVPILTYKVTDQYTFLDPEAMLRGPQKLYAIYKVTKLAELVYRVEIWGTVSPIPPEVPAITPFSFVLALLSLFGLAAVAMRKMYKR